MNDTRINSEFHALTATNLLLACPVWTAAYLMLATNTQKLVHRLNFAGI